MTKNLIEALKMKRNKISFWRVIETIAFLISGAIAFQCLLYVIYGILVNIRNMTLPTQSSMGATVILYVICAGILLVPPLTLFASIKAIRNKFAVRWVAIIAVMAGLFGGAVMLLGFGIGWHYAAESGVKINYWLGILAAGGTALLSSLPYAIIAIKRFSLGKQNKVLEEGGEAAR